MGLKLTPAPHKARAAEHPPGLRLVNGMPALSIEGAKGPADYPLRPAPCPPGGWACVVGAYAVSVDAEGVWACACDHCKYKGVCKHIEAVKPLRALLSLWELLPGLAPAPEPPKAEEPNASRCSLMEMAYGADADAVRAKVRRQNADLVAYRRRYPADMGGGEAPPPVTRADLAAMEDRILDQVAQAIKDGGRRG